MTQANIYWGPTALGAVALSATVACVVFNLVVIADAIYILFVSTWILLLAKLFLTKNYPIDPSNKERIPGDW
jgi:hypothetical protein